MTSLTKRKTRIAPLVACLLLASLAAAAPVIQPPSGRIAVVADPVTHHRFNDGSGDFFKWEDLLATGVTEVRISNQNIGLKVPMAEWDWAKTHPHPSAVSGN